LFAIFLNSFPKEIYLKKDENLVRKTVFRLKMAYIYLRTKRATD